MKNFEYHLYKQLASYFNDKKEGKVEFKITTGHYQVVEIFGMKVRFNHGDYFSYSGGILGMGVNVVKKITIWNSADHCDLDVFGHWHTSQTNRIFISNGSLIGYSPYAHKIGAAFEQPQQAFALINNKRGFNIYSPIFVEDKIYANGDI